MNERDALFTFYVTVIAIDVNVISKAMQSLVSRNKIAQGDVNIFSHFFSIDREQRFGKHVDVTSNYSDVKCK